MSHVAVITDSISCLPADIVERFQIHILPINLYFGDKVYRDGIDMTPAEFYSRLRQAKNLPTTSGALPGPYLEAYSRASEKASSILCITLSARLSGMFDSARLAMEQAGELRPNVSITVLDGGTAAAAQGLVVLAAARAAASGASLDEVVETAESVMQRVSLFAVLDTLHYLVRGGRVPRAAGLVNSFLKVKPVFTISDGEVHPVALARTTTNAIDHLIEEMGQNVIEGQPLHVAVMHADAMDNAVVLRDQIAAKFKCQELFITEFTPVMGVHTGPGVIGVAFYSGD